jgi:hypothetical protein
MTTTKKRSLFIARKVDGAAEFIEARGAVTISELAEYLAGTGVDVRGYDGLMGRELARYRGDKRFAALPVIATGSTEFVLIMLALLVNRNVELDLSDPALIKLIWGGRWDEPAERKPREIKTPTGGHYHILEVRDPGGPEQVVKCWEGKGDLGFVCQYLDEIYFPEIIDEGWEAIWIVGCGPDRCRRDEICDLPVEEWGKPYWGGDAVYAAAHDDNPYLVHDVDAEEPPF